VKRKPAEIAAVALLALAGGCCLCVLLAWAALDALGWVASAPFRLFQRREPAELTLRRALEEELDAAFSLGEECTILEAGGSTVRSAPDSGDSFSTDLPREEVFRVVIDAIRGKVFRVRSGSLTFDDGTPVRASLLPGDRVSIAFSEEDVTDISVVAQALEGVVTGNTFTGRFHYSEDLSSVVAGQGVEEATSLDASLTCPLQWTETELVR
jgi:hypothetical protein